MKAIFIIVMLKCGAPWRDVKVFEMDTQETCSVLQSYNKDKFKIHVEPSSKSRFTMAELRVVQGCFKRYTKGKKVGDIK